MNINPGQHQILIGIDSDVLAGLKQRAEPFVDDPNTVLRRLLQLDGTSEPNGSKVSYAQLVEPEGHVAARSRSQATGKGRRKAVATNKAPRAPKGSLTPEDAFEQPILRALEEAGGQLSVREVVNRVGEQLNDVLNTEDRFEDNRGIARWEKRTHFVRLKMVDRGLLSPDAPRGTWQLTDLGREQVHRTALAAR